MNPLQAITKGLSRGIFPVPKNVFPKEIPVKQTVINPATLKSQINSKIPATVTKPQLVPIMLPNKRAIPEKQQILPVGKEQKQIPQRSIDSVANIVYRDLIAILNKIKANECGSREDKKGKEVIEQRLQQIEKMVHTNFAMIKRQTQVCSPNFKNEIKRAMSSTWWAGISQDKLSELETQIIDIILEIQAAICEDTRNDKVINEDKLKQMIRSMYANFCS